MLKLLVLSCRGRRFKKHELVLLIMRKEEYYIYHGSKKSNLEICLDLEIILLLSR